ncbi:hypothetical protein PsorP6_012329 [Peronosclerospora sorghi]|uniref:Uncharacterized protein n=1 Tax=Peronosclerospora sorghi TaxID=230839 RepID=A0ACC0WIX7_9STRA|nr:hypothetical protein PsorP6_012329 [Peronosclerospora sorghi]
MICTLDWISLRRTPSPEQIQAEAHARTVRNLPPGDLQRKNLTCISWRATGTCTPDRPRQVAQDLPCHAIVPSGKSGYCEVQDVDTTERFRVMRLTCSRYVKSHVFQCSDAPDFVQYHLDTLDAVERAIAPKISLTNSNARDHAGQYGIVMVVYPGLLNSAYAIIRTLRDVLGCQLPLQLWYREDEVRHVPNNLQLKRMEKTSPDILETPREPDGMPDRIIWTHLLTFRKNRLCSEYLIEPFVAPPDFSKAQKC